MNDVVTDTPDARRQFSFLRRSVFVCAVLPFGVPVRSFPVPATGFSGLKQNYDAVSSVLDLNRHHDLVRLIAHDRNAGMLRSRIDLDPVRRQILQIPDILILEDENGRKCAIETGPTGFHKLPGAFFRCEAHRFLVPVQCDDHSSPFPLSGALSRACFEDLLPDPLLLGNVKCAFDKQKFCFSDNFTVRGLGTVLFKSCHPAVYWRSIYRDIDTFNL